MKNFLTAFKRELDASWILKIALAVCVIFVLCGIFAPWLVPMNPNAQNLQLRLLPPMTDGHFLGTDLLGRDVLSRLIMGSRISLVIATAAIVLSVTIGVLVGLISGYVGGWLDTVLMRIVDAWLAFPFLLLAIAVVAILGPGLVNIVIALVVSEWVLYVRLVRGVTLSLREREFVESARMLGVRNIPIMIKHILPNIFASIMVVATLEIGIIIVTEASLSFLGLGVDASEPSWGAMLADGKAYMTAAWWLATIPGLVIFLVVLAINLVGDTLQDALDPKSSRPHELRSQARKRMFRRRNQVSVESSTGSKFST